MITINIDPVLLHLGPLAIRWYGLMYAVGIVAGLYVAIPFATKRGLPEDDIWTVFWPAVFAGVVGARLYFVIQQPIEPYLQEPWRIVATWEGGMAFFGAIIGVVLAMAVVCWRSKINFWKMLDAGALFAVVGQGFGRIGNIVNGDIVGYPTDGTWGVIYAHPGSFVADRTIAYQPAAVYELFFNVALFAILWTVRGRLRKPGLLFALYLTCYSVGQFLLFFLRDNEVVAFGLKQAQLTAVVALAVALALWWWRLRQGAPGTETTALNPADSGQDAPA